jgi:hypothetical protein
MRRENAKVYLSFSVIPGRAQREPGIHCAAEFVDQWIPGLRQVAHPGMTGVFCSRCERNEATTRRGLIPTSSRRNCAVNIGRKMAGNPQA